MASVLRKPVGPEQQALLQVIGEPFIATGKWPVWQYVDLTLENQHGLDAGAVLASLPEAGDKSPTSPGCGLTWRPDSYRQPHAGDRVTLTVAGLRYLPQAGQRVIQRAVTTAEHRLQRQLHQRRDRPVRADRRVGQLEQRIGPGGQALIEPGTEPGQPGQRLDASGIVHHTHLYGLRAIG